jgi:hypothetical protein
VAKRLILEGDVDWVVLSYAITAFWAHGLFHVYHERHVVIFKVTGLLPFMLQSVKATSLSKCARARRIIGTKIQKFGCVSMLDVKEK